MSINRASSAVSCHVLILLEQPLISTSQNNENMFLTTELWANSGDLTPYGVQGIYFELANRIALLGTWIGGIYRYYMYVNTKHWLHSSPRVQVCSEKLEGTTARKWSPWRLQYIYRCFRTVHVNYQGITPNTKIAESCIFSVSSIS